MYLSISNRRSIAIKSLLLKIFVECTHKFNRLFKLLLWSLFWSRSFLKVNDMKFAIVDDSQEIENNRFKSLIRDLALFVTYFLKETSIEQHHFVIHDKDFFVKKKEFVHKNVVTVMTLNECATHNDWEFFYFLKSKTIWTKIEISLCLNSRSASQLEWVLQEVAIWTSNWSSNSSRYFDLIYINYVWVDELRDNFWHNSQRLRLLMCDALMNSFATSTSLFAIQFAYNKLASTYITFEESLIVFATLSIYYLERTFVMINIVRRWFDKEYTFEHAKWRLNITSFLWAKSSKSAKSESQKRKSRKMNETSIRINLQSLVVSNIIALYNEIVRECRFEILLSTFYARDLREIISHVISFDLDYSLSTLFEDNSRNANDSSNSITTTKTYEVVNSSTRREDRLLDREEAKIVTKKQSRARINDLIKERHTIFNLSRSSLTTRKRTIHLSSF